MGGGVDVVEMHYMAEITYCVGVLVDKLQPRCPRWKGWHLEERWGLC